MRFRLRDHGPEIAFAAFAAAMVSLMFALPEWEAVPFHFVWVSLTILYGFRLWGHRATAALFTAVGVATSIPLLTTAPLDNVRLGELAEVPLMTIIFIAMVWHVRRRIAALDALRRGAQRERDFVADASHQLRTPITVARGHTELIRAALSDDQTTADADVVLDELERLGRISERLLILAAAEQPDFLMLERVEVTEVARHLVHRWSAVPDRHWELRAGVRGGLLVDRERLATALDALVENAIRATAPGDAIVVETGAHGGTATLAVLDTGEGIPSEHLERVFDRFARLPHADGRHAAGTGLGLPMVRAIVEAHGGTVTASNEPGGGTRVELRLPGFTRAALAAPLEAPAPAPATAVG